MSNDEIKLNAVINEIGTKISKLAELGQDGFDVSLVSIPDELALTMGRSWRPTSNDLLWFQALKTIVHARQMLEQSARILDQTENDETIQKLRIIMSAFDEQFHPADTALQVYDKLGRSLDNHLNGASLTQR